MRRFWFIVLSASITLADSISIVFDHPAMGWRSATINCSDVLSDSRVTVDFEAGISTWGDVWTINVRSSDSGSPVIQVMQAGKTRVTGTLTFDLKPGGHPLEVVVTKTNGQTFSRTSVVEIYDDTNGTCPK